RRVLFRSHVIELPPAVIGDVDAVDAVLAGDRCVLAGLDAFEDQRQLAAMLVLEALHLGPRQRLLPVVAAIVDDRAIGNAPRDIALAPAINGAVDRVAEGLVTGIDATSDDLVGHAVGTA